MAGSGEGAPSTTPSGLVYTGRSECRCSCIIGRGAAFRGPVNNKKWGCAMKRTAGDILKTKEGGIIAIAADSSIRAALELMVANRVGAVVVEEDGVYAGIWTERDLMGQILEPGFDIDRARVGDHMSRELITAQSTEQVYQLYDKFLGRRIRHLLIKEGDDCIGMLSVGDVIRGSLQQKIEEYRELNEMVSLEYYENWKQKRAERH